MLAGDLGVQPEHVLSLVLEVRGGIEAIGNEEAVGGLAGWDVSLRNGHEFLLDLAEHVHCDLNLLLWVVGLDGSADNRHVVILLADRVN